MAKTKGPEAETLPQSSTKYTPEKALQTLREAIELLPENARAGTTQRLHALEEVVSWAQKTEAEVDAEIEKVGTTASWDRLQTLFKTKQAVDSTILLAMQQAMEIAIIIRAFNPTAIGNLIKGLEETPFHFS